MNCDNRRVVAAGYDDIGDAYLERFGVSTVRQMWLERLIGCLPTMGARVLDLGCGCGVPVAHHLATRRHIVVGVDGSPRQIARARHNVPAATFLEADMCDVTFASASFDAIGAFYSITHVPPAKQGSVIASIATWLKPGGTLVASFGAGDAGEWTEKWLGTTMFFGHAGEVETLRSLANAGLRVRNSKIEKQDNEKVAFLWVEATKDRSALQF